MRLEDLPQGIVLPAAASQADTSEGGKADESGTSASEASQSNEIPSKGDSPGNTGGPAYPTVILQARRNMHKFANCVLLTRVGGFYELYFEHAQEYGPLLNIKVASKKTNAGPVPMVSLSLLSVSMHLVPLSFFVCPSASPPTPPAISYHPSYPSSHSALSPPSLANPNGG